MGVLTGKFVDESYKQVLNVGDANVGLADELKPVTDGEGSTSPLKLSKTAIGIEGITDDLSGLLDGIATSLGEKEVTTNKAIDFSVINDTKYPSIKAVNDALSLKQNSIGYTPENVINKATDFVVINDTRYPTTKAVNDLMAAAVAGLLDYRGTFNASVNAYPSAGGSGSGGSVLKSDFWIVSVAGVLPVGLVVEAGDMVISKIDAPGNIQANWNIIQYNLGFVPVPNTRKINGFDLTADILVPSVVSYLKVGRYLTAQVVAAASSVVATGSSSLRAYPLIIPRRVRMIEIFSEVTTLQAGSTFRAALYKDNGAVYPGDIVPGTDALAYDGATNGIKNSVFDIILEPGLYFPAYNGSSGAGPVLRGITSASMAAVLQYSAANVDNRYAAAFAFGPMPAVFPAGATLTGNVSVCDIKFKIGELL